MKCIGCALCREARRRRELHACHRGLPCLTASLPPRALEGARRTSLSSRAPRHTPTKRSLANIAENRTSAEMLACKYVQSFPARTSRAEVLRRPPPPRENQLQRRLRHGYGLATSNGCHDEPQPLCRELRHIASLSISAPRAPSHDPPRHARHPEGASSSNPTTAAAQKEEQGTT